jgi:hypothetical protein
MAPAAPLAPCVPETGDLPARREVLLAPPPAAAA